MTSIISSIQALIGQPTNHIDLINNGVVTQYPCYDMQYILAAVLVVMTIFFIYSLLLTIVKNIGGKKK